VSLRPGSRFGEVYRSGRRTRRGGLTVITAPGSGDLPEVGIVVGRKVGNAVRRNRVKRRIREAASRVSLRGGTAYVVVASPEAADVGFGDMVEWLTEAVGLDAS